MSNTDTTKNHDRHHVLAKGKQFLLLIRHTPCYSYKTTVRLPQTLVTLADCRIYSISVARLFLFLKEFIIICVWFNTLSVIPNFPVVSVSYNVLLEKIFFGKCLPKLYKIFISRISLWSSNRHDIGIPICYCYMVHHVFMLPYWINIPFVLV